ncbi:MAG: AraC family transcriptional regulator [Ancalomicrobiaceae bacterium]|nr:AraC family transcriptional regulator [Ancalomicrobiaceae bacterium]
MPEAPVTDLLQAKRQSDRTYAERYVRQFKTDAIAQIVAPGRKTSRLLVSRLQHDSPDHGLTEPMDLDAVFSVLIQLRRQDRRELYLDGKLVHRGSFPERTVSIVNHWQRPTANLLSAFDTVIFTVSQAALNEAAEDQGAPPVQELVCEVEGCFDDTVWHLAQSLLPALERPEEVGSMYAEGVLLASTTYFAHAFGGMRPPPDARHRLSPAQIERAIDLMQGRLGEDISLSMLAAEMDLSPRHFARAFRQTTGETPDRWLRRQRVERAKAMMRETALSVSQIATSCGFASPAHFSRVFASAVGVSPNVWRTQILN